MNDKHKELAAKIAGKQARVGVIGLGYVGLPLALLFEERGFPVIGFDVDPRKKEALDRGESYIRHIGKERVEGAKGFKVTGFVIDYSKCMFCALCVEPCPVDCIFMGATHDLSCYSRDGCIVDFSRMPVDVAWGRSTLNPTAVADSKVITEPVHGGPNQ